MKIFLDFDGVLHPDDVYNSKRGLELRAPGHLMMHAPVLQTILDEIDPHGDIKIILSTSWVRIKGFDRTKKYLSDGLASRVIGATWHSGMVKRQNDFRNSLLDPFLQMSRFQQIEWYLKRHPTKEWLAIDDLHSGAETWPEDMSDHLVLTDPDNGLGCLNAQNELVTKLRRVGIL
ncbi:MAG TPA: HAD domain-containing protein [Methylophilaceae bacterium]|jgi:hypothetical protein